MTAPWKSADGVAERQACIRLALTLRGLSWFHRRGAEAAYAANDIIEYHRASNEARRLWRDAKWYLKFARGLRWTSD